MATTMTTTRSSKLSPARHPVKRQVSHPLLPRFLVATSYQPVTAASCHQTNRWHQLRISFSRDWTLPLLAATLISAPATG